MSKKILSFEEYVREADRSEEIEKEVAAAGEVENLEDKVEDNEEEVEVAEETEEVAETEEEEVTETEEETEEVAETEEEEVAETEEEEVNENPALVAMAASELMKEMYEKACEEAKAYENDDYDEHTVESYMAENAALIAALAADKLKEAYESVHDEEMSQEQFEAACESMKESYAKKIDEIAMPPNPGLDAVKGAVGMD
jgi:hypothetical protein